MRHEQRPWLATVPWSQVLGVDGHVWTVLPHYPPHERRISRPGVWPVTFAPGFTTTTVLVPDDADAMAALAATFGLPELIAWKDDDASVWWTCPPAVESTVLAHLRDWHGTLDRGSSTARLTHESSAHALAYHWQLHQQQLVHPDPLAGRPHFH